MMPSPKTLHRRAAHPAVALALLLAAAAPAAAAESQLTRLIRTSDLKDTQVSAYVLDADTGQELAAIHADRPMIPASNMKLVTTIAALDVLGPQFVFTTELGWLTAEQTAAAERPSVDGDDAAEPAPAGGASQPEPRALPSLLVRGDGDPGFGDTKLLRTHAEDFDVEAMVALWVNAVKKTGVKNFDAILLDDRVFDRQFVHPTWPENQLDRWYCAEVAGINFYHNVVDVYAAPGHALGTTPRVWLFPKAPWLRTSNNAQTGRTNGFGVTRPRTANQFRFYGSVKHRLTSPVHVTVHDPPVFFAELLKDRLSDEGVGVARIARVHADAAPPQATPLHRIRTTLPLVLERTNTDSQNLFAEALLKRMGYQLTGDPGSWPTGAAAIRQAMQKRLGPKAATFTIADGSGMSRDNRVTARLLGLLLHQVHHDAVAGPLLRDSLASAGRDPEGRYDSTGTFRGGDRFADLPHGVTVHGKSGYINRVSSLSGYLVIPGDDGSRPRTIVFSFLFNGFTPPLNNSRMKDVQGEMLKLVVEELTAERARVGG